MTAMKPHFRTMGENEAYPDNSVMSRHLFIVRLELAGLGFEIEADGGFVQVKHGPKTTRWMPHDEAETKEMARAIRRES